MTKKLILNNCKNLLKSKSIMGKLSSKDTLNKLKSEEFLLMIKMKLKN